LAAGKRAKPLGHQGRQARTEAKRLGRQAGTQARKAGGEINKGADNPWVDRAARLGYVIRGLLYGAMGASGIGFALGVWHRATDQRGALFMVKGRPGIEVAVSIAVIVGLAGYALWGFIRAIFDPLRKGHDADGIAARLGFAWSGLSYAGLLVFTIQFLLGMTQGDGSDSVEKTIRFVMARPFGVFVTGLIGAISVLVGLGQFVDAYKAGFRGDLKRTEMSTDEKRLADALGRFGMFSRGVIFAMLGGFIIQAALLHDAAKAEGMGAAMQTLAQEPGGHLALFVVAAGFIALGLHSFACARWIRIARAR
jgi:hypothetical protein